MTPSLRSGQQWASKYFERQGTVARWWDPLAEEDPDFRKWYSGQLEDVIAVARPANNRILDAATGRGRAAIAAARRGGTVVAADISTEMLLLARDAAVEQKVSDCIDFVRTDLDRISFRAEQFDVILLLEVLLHFDHPDRVLANLAEALTPGGLLIVTTNGANPISRLLQPGKKGSAPASKWKLSMATAVNEVMSFFFGFVWARTYATGRLYGRFFSAPVRPLYPFQVKRMLAQAGFTSVYHRACPNGLAPREHRWAAYKK